MNNRSDDRLMRGLAWLVSIGLWIGGWYAVGAIIFYWLMWRQGA